MQSCIVAGIVANKIAGNIDLGISAARRGYDMACRQGDPGLMGLALWSWAGKLVLLTARGSAWPPAGTPRPGRPTAHLKTPGELVATVNPLGSSAARTTLSATKMSTPFSCAGQSGG
ncbi:MAG: hypothetical protein ACRDRP_19375 [Pseudonocardiaceae bacterium]